MSQQQRTSLNDVTEIAFEKRWSAWKEKNKREEQAFRAKVKVVLPIVIGIIAVMFYVIRLRS